MYEELTYAKTQQKPVIYGENGLDANATCHKLPVRYFTELLAEALGVK